ncbi:hypothetical protein, partial [Bradyrhizobium sp.]|uniref:hypothetical protein n=1 Tax=Bradyrhizobium sp. TaxID=376 RepID=UPI003C5ADC5E
DRAGDRGRQRRPERPAPFGVRLHVVIFREGGDLVVHPFWRIFAVDLTGRNVCPIEQDLGFDDSGVELLARRRLGKIRGIEGRGINFGSSRREWEKSRNQYWAEPGAKHSLRFRIQAVKVSATAKWSTH